MPIAYPDSLPCPLLEGYSLSHVSPLLRSELVTGRARQRRRYTTVPTIVTVQWVLSTQQAQVFEAWFRWELKDGAEWASLPLKTPMGLSDCECRFTEMYAGPRPVASDHWRIEARVELRERQTLAEGWELLGQYLLYADVFDRAVNAEWPYA